MTMPNNKIYLALVMSFALIGCGGGGGGSAAPAQAAEDTAEAVAEETTEVVEEVESVVESTAQSMQDLVIPDGFSFDPITEMNIDIDISNLSTQRAYVSIYSEYEETDSGTLAPSGDHKLAGQALEAGMGNIDIVYADGVEKVLAEIWFYDGSDPIQKELTIDDNTFYY
ncbi:hypothetical protein [Vibrio agarivorans]|uniref:hypothetical protein n=1 Tax=Vibrio agarivorans TaxID=153622 RepID=UPI0025B453FE|nr:hypothetical protein [Vibrio agarivorans]MDN3663060.1 hypothetical protein [Vibrio agarivorans]